MQATIHIFNSSYTPESFVKSDFSDHDFPGLLSAQHFIQFLLDDKQFFDQKTSGSTGTPTIHKISRQQLTASAQRTNSALNLTSQTKALVCINMDYIGGKMMLARGIMGGWHLHLVPPGANPAEQVELNQSFDFMALVPLQLETMLASQAGTRLLNQTTKIIVGGAAVSEALKEKLQPLASQLYATYGMTETVSHVALQKLNGTDKTDHFQMLAGIDFSLDNRHCLKLKADVTNHEWIQTNDVVALEGERAFRILGRADNVINSGGVKIQLEQLESQIAQTTLLPDTSFAVSAQADESLGQQLVLVIEGGIQNSQDLLARLKALLPQYHNPRKLVVVDSLPKTASGKLDRLALVQLLSKH